MTQKVINNKVTSDASKHDKAIIRASGFYLTEHLTVELINGPEDELDTFIENHLWEPFEDYSGDHVYGFIVDLAASFEELMI